MDFACGKQASKASIGNYMTWVVIVIAKQAHKCLDCDHVTMEVL